MSYLVHCDAKECTVSRDGLIPGWSSLALETQNPEDPAVYHFCPPHSHAILAMPATDLRAKRETFLDADA